MKGLDPVDYANPHEFRAIITARHHATCKENNAKDVNTRSISKKSNRGPRSARLRV